MDRQPDLEAKSKLAIELALQRESEALEAADKVIFQGLDVSVNKIKSLVNSSEESISLKAAREHLLLAGLYVERVEHSGKVKLVPTELEMDV